MSTKWMFLTPLKAKFLTISLPSPPAPTTSIGISGIASQQQEVSSQSFLKWAWLTRKGLRLAKSLSRGYELSCIKNMLYLMSLEQRLSNIFPQPFQINRLVKEIQVLKDAKPKVGFELKYITRQNTQFVLIVQIIRQRIKQYKRLAFLNKLQFKISLKNSYPTQAPSVYFLNENAVELGINPFHDYLRNVVPDWTPKISLLDIIRMVPAFVVQVMEKSIELKGVANLREYFEAERLFSFQGCQTFPVKIFRGKTSFIGIIGIINGEEIVLLEQSNFANCYITTDFIKIQEVYSVQKHKSNHLRSLLEVRRNKQRYAVQFSSDEFQTIIGAIVEKMKALAIFDKETAEESDSDDEVVEEQKPSNPSQEFVITDKNIKEVESQIIILFSLSQSKPNSSNVKELVDLLKKAVEYYSILGDQRCNVHLKTLQSIMNNELLQVLLESQDDKVRNKKDRYESIANYV